MILALDREDALTFSKASRRHGQAIWSLVSESGALETNTCYAYMLLVTHFADSCVVAEVDDTLLGFVCAYHPPTHPEAVFVWQIGVRESARGLGLATRLLHQLVAQCRDAVYLEATVATSNEASVRLFERFARDRNTHCERQAGFVSDDFLPLAHESEPLLRIGPLRTSTPALGASHERDH